MGGDHSGIDESTTDVLLEVAFFAPDAIAGRGRRYGLVTDASQRFERGVDPTLQERAIERATAAAPRLRGRGRRAARRSRSSRTSCRRRARCVCDRHVRGTVIGAEIARRRDASSILAEPRA